MRDSWCYGETFLPPLLAGGGIILYTSRQLDRAGWFTKDEVRLPQREIGAWLFDEVSC